MPRTEGENAAIFIAVYCVFTVLSWIAFAFRLKSKSMMEQKWSWDDLLLLIALLIGGAQYGWYAVGTTTAGIGHHQTSLSDAQIVQFEQCFYVSGFTHPTALAAAKMAVLILLHRIFARASKAFRWTIYALSFVVIGWWVAIIFADAFICLPVKSWWDVNTPGHCGNERALERVDPLPWIVTDFIILLVPYPMIWKLHMQKKRKISLAAIFLLGSLTCTVSCVRYSYTFYNNSDVTYDIVDVGVLSILEGYVTIICASVLAARPVLLSIGNFFWMHFNPVLSPLASVASSCEKRLIEFGSNLKSVSSASLKAARQRSHSSSEGRSSHQGSAGSHDLESATKNDGFVHSVRSWSDSRRKSSK